MSDFLTSTLKLGRKISFVLWLIDQHTSLGSNEEVDVYLNGIPASYQRKAGGYLIFTDLEQDYYRVEVESPVYLPAAAEVAISQLDRAEPVVYLLLKPAPAYRFNTGATLVRASLTDAQGSPVSAPITAAITSDNGARARLGRQGAKAGLSEMQLIDQTGRIAPGDLVLVRSPESQGGEICELSTMGAEEGLYRLKSPLTADHNRGELLMPVFATHSDSRGEAVISIRGLRQKQVQAEITFGTGKSAKKMDLTITSGQIHQLGKIII